ncbi:MAG: FAD-dependent oxidoreductase [Geminicoccaceae bacterium]
MRIAIIGAGVSGLGAAWVLGHRHDVTVFEAEERLGGHAHTVSVDHGGRRIDVDTGFIVYNERNYPLLTRLFAHLGIATEASDMSFSASIGDGALEYAGSNLATMFAQKRNLARPGFLRMLADIARFNAAAKRFVADGGDERMPLGAFLDRGGYGRGFREWYLLPMAAAIWSAPVATMLAFPALSFLSFFRNHGLLEINDRPKWRTVSGGSQRYVTRLVTDLGLRVRRGRAVADVRRVPGGVAVSLWGGDRYLFDHVVLACHSDQALGMLGDARDDERRALSAIPYQPNRAILHADPALMPRRRSVWSSWNYAAPAQQEGTTRVAVTYWMNRLQNLDPDRPLFVSLNPLREPDPTLVFGEWRYDHPVFEGGALEAQRTLRAIQGRDRIWFAGAWMGHGFHEDGLRSGFAVAEGLGVRPPWDEPVRSLPGTSIGLPERAAAHPV